MRACWLDNRQAWFCLLVLACLAAPSPCAVAQRLDLPVGEDADGAYARALLGVLEAEITAHGLAVRGAPEAERPRRRAALTLRILAAELLSRGASLEEGGELVTLLGLRLARGRDDVDDALESLDHPEANEILTAFDDRAIDQAEMLRAASPHDAPRALADVLAPLVELLVDVREITLVSHWPLADPAGAGAPSPEGLIDTVDAVTWLPDDVRASFSSTVLTAVAATEDRPAELRRVTRDLDRRVTLLSRMDALRSRGVRIDALAPAVLEGDENNLDRMAAIVARLERARIAESAKVLPPLRRAFGEIRRRESDAQSALLIVVGRMEDVDVWTDPAWMSVLVEHADAVADLERMAGAAPTLERLTSIVPRRRSRALHRVREVFLSLGEGPQPQVARTVIDALLEQADRLSVQPFEGRLRDADAAAITAVGGDATGFLAAMDDTRAVWAETWIERGSTSAIERRLEILAELCALGPIVADLAPADTLARWAAWEAVPGRADEMEVQVGARFKLAVVSAADGQYDRARDQLHAIRPLIPVAEVEQAILRALGEELELLPSGFDAWLSMIGPHALPDGPARFEAHRELIARYCIARHDAEHLSRGDDSRATERARARVDELARDVLERVGLPIN